MDIHTILTALPKQRRTGLFSATLTSELKRLMTTGMRNPVHVCVKRKAAPVADAPAIADKDKSDAIEDGSSRHELPSKLENYYLRLQAHHRIAFLKTFLTHAQVKRGKTIVFFLTCACVDLFYGLLREVLDNFDGISAKK